MHTDPAVQLFHGHYTRLEISYILEISYSVPHVQMSSKPLKILVRMIGLEPPPPIDNAQLADSTLRQNQQMRLISICWYISGTRIALVRSAEDQVLHRHAAAKRFDSAYHLFENCPA
jgi:hypothetical protein